MSDVPASAMPCELDASMLRRTCTDEELIGDGKPSNIFDDLFIGVDQGRLLQALELGLHDSSRGHIFVAGLSGPQALNALKSFVVKFLKSSNKKLPKPKDWCYLYNFDDPLQPVVIALECTKGKRLKDHLEKLLVQLQEKIPAALSRQDVVHKCQQIEYGFQMWVEFVRRDIIRKAKQEDILVTFEKQGRALVNPISKKLLSPTRRGKEKPPQFMDADELEAQSPQDRERLIRDKKKWLLTVQMHFEELREKSIQAADATAEVNRQAVRGTVEGVFDSLNIQSSKQGESYVEKLKNYAIDHFGIFDRRYQQQHRQQAPHEDLFLPFKINVYVDNSEESGPPVVVEQNATFQDLVGRIEHVVGGNVIYTDHTKVAAGSSQRANGGYLILDAMNLLKNQSYEVLKRILNNESVKTEEYSSFLGIGSTVSLQPRPIPLQVKIILAGSRYLWSMLAYHDPEFFDHFDIKAEVAPMVDWTLGEAAALGAWTKRYAQIERLVPPDVSALKRIVEYSSRMADSSKSLSTNYAPIEAVLREASFLAEKEKASYVSATHVRAAIDRKFYRSSLRQEYMQGMIRDKKILLPLKGEPVIGQMTILSVSDLGDISMGFPGRITVQWSMGRPGFLSIHREAGLAGDNLKKAELTVQAHLMSMFAKKYPWSAAISYTAEQMYGKVDGDSASLGLFCAIISALSGIGIRPDIAITGSLSLFGQPQPIGGANEKIEGFFESCVLIGLTGTQGVIIPRSNVDELMLNERVVEAVENQAFHLWPIDHEDEVIRILMGRDAGKPEANYTYTPGSIYDLVDKNLSEIARNARRFFSEDSSSVVVC